MALKHQVLTDELSLNQEQTHPQVNMRLNLS